MDTNSDCEEKGDRSMENNDLSIRAMKHEQYLNKWIPIINSCVNSGLSKQEWCKQNGINIKSYFYWQKKIFDASVDTDVEFAELPSPVKELPGQQEDKGVIATVSINGISVNLLSGIDSKTVTAIVKGLSNV